MNPYTGLTRRERLDKWRAERHRVADKWLGGDTRLADDLMNAMPYHEEPTWAHVNNIIKIINEGR